MVKTPFEAMVCDDLKLWPDQEVCQGNGDCLSVEDDFVSGVNAANASVLCQCSSEFAVKGDLWPFPRTRCDKRKAVVQGVWAFASFVCFFSFVMGCVGIHKRIKQKGLKRDMPFLAFFATIVTSLLLFALGVHRAVNVDSVIGDDVAASLLFSLALTFYWPSLLFYSSIFLNVLTLQARIFNSASSGAISRRFTWKNIQKLSWLAMAFAVLTSFLPALMLVPEHPPTKLIIVQIFSFNISVIIALLGVYMMSFCTALLRYLRDVQTPSSNNNLHSFSKQVEMVRSQSLQAALMNSLLSMLFGFWPFLTSVYSIELPLGYASGLLVQISLIYLLSFHRSSSSGTPASPSSSGKDKDGAQHNKGSHATTAVVAAAADTATNTTLTPAGAGAGAGAETELPHTTNAGTEHVTGTESYVTDY